MSPKNDGGGRVDYWNASRDLWIFFTFFFLWREGEREGDLEILVTVPKGEAREGEGRWIKLERLEADEEKIRGRWENSCCSIGNGGFSRGLYLYEYDTITGEMYGSTKSNRGKGKKFARPVLVVLYFKAGQLLCRKGQKKLKLKGASPFCWACSMMRTKSITWLYAKPISIYVIQINWPKLQILIWTLYHSIGRYIKEALGCWAATMMTVEEVSVTDRSKQCWWQREDYKRHQEKSKIPEPSSPSFSFQLLLQGLPLQEALLPKWPMTLHLLFSRGLSSHNLLMSWIPTDLRLAHLHQIGWLFYSSLRLKFLGMRSQASGEGRDSSYKGYLLPRA